MGVISKYPFWESLGTIVPNVKLLVSRSNKIRCTISNKQFICIFVLFKRISEDNPNRQFKSPVKERKNGRMQRNSPAGIFSGKTTLLDLFLS